ncbi:MAG: cytochrome c oxidase accessory protein CcoG [Gemmatimonadaceae bacterium]
MSTSAQAPPVRSGRVLPTLNEDGTRRWIRPKPSHGKWWQRRRVVAYALMVVFFAVPHIRLFGKPLFLMDLPHRQFTLLTYTFLPTDTLLFMLVMASGVLGIFLVTAFFGRAWCGWACPQTVYLEFLFRPIGRWFDGGYTGSRNLDKKSAWFTPRRIAKYATFLLLSLFVAHTVLAYFVGTDHLYDWMTHSPAEHPTSFLLVAVVTGLVWFNFTYFREQTCLIVCPYGRWQAALLDQQSLIVAYDTGRGEPRALGPKATRAPDAGTGDCISCNACVQTCPTGIDIRNGLQMECVHCTQCIDACDDVMTRVGQPTGLIRYTTQAALAGRGRHWLRLRTILYPTLLLILGGSLVVALVMKQSADVTVLRGIGAPFVEESDGRIANQVRVKISNRGDNAASYALKVEGGEQALPDGFNVIAPENPLEIAAGATRETSIFVLMPRAGFVKGERFVQLHITDGHKFETTISYRLLGPEPSTGGKLQ